ncbi:aspartate dehydrogenase domain-containing protein [Streptomyces purpurogeneiscleroticus]|uniref:aspartate dehydrogenase domain-containing protein n=1 Tax=Streptomyces purpurogeneiscleroticus TaxID=68259 RepID=UPI001CBCD237|nr:aspartate dehydrogenase domain-containing protein [Streptomyces purpurogeneiscleroticus]MBZ4020511.1 aspartate dehydrogenase [Streptomyces purpurogeneiscleroticus]
MTPPTSRKVGLVGWGAIGRIVGTALAEGNVPGAELICIVDNRALGDAPVPQLSFEDALDHCDLIVEAAGQSVVREWGERVLRSGTDLLVASTGALTDEDLASALLAAGPGRVYFTGGAVGGLDLLQAVRSLGPLADVTLTTTKLPGTLEQPWMDEDLLHRMRTATGPVEVMRGTARDVPVKFPKSTNVAASVALAVGDLDAVRVHVVADPAARHTRHVIEASGSHGVYRFEVQHLPDPGNPATSQVVPYAVLRSLGALAGRRGQIL